MKDEKENIDKYLKTIYKEIIYVKLDFLLLDKLDKSRDTNNYLLEKIDTIHFAIIDSLWYTIIMRLAKLWDTDKKSHSLRKIINKISSAPEMKDLRKKNNLKNVNEIVKNIDKAYNDFNEEGEYNFIKESRNNYYGHLGEFNSSKEAQNKYKITRNKIENIISTLFVSVENLCMILQIDTEKDFKDIKEIIDTKIDLEYSYFIKLLK